LPGTQVTPLEDSPLTARVLSNIYAHSYDLRDNAEFSFGPIRGLVVNVTYRPLPLEMEVPRPRDYARSSNVTHQRLFNVETRSPRHSTWSVVPASDPRPDRQRRGR